MGDFRALGVFDSGLGGLTVVKELCKFLPDESIVYFGDTGRVPYGTRSKEIIRKYALQDENFLIKHDVKLIIAACGTVSSVASDTAKSLPVPFFEVVSHSVRDAVSKTRNKRIGVVGTAATIKSEKHAELIKSLMPDATVTAVNCNLFVPLVEEGWTSSEDAVVLETVKRYLKPIIDAGCDTLILGCTHYPVLTDAISKVLGKDVTLINAGTATATAVAKFLKENGMCSDKRAAGHTFYVSDKADSFKKQASILLGEEINESSVKQVDIDSIC